MPTIDTYKKQAKLLVRWHRAGNHSIGGRIRQLDRYRTLSDRDALAMPFPLHEAQEIIALEAGHTSWADLKASADAASSVDEPSEHAVSAKLVSTPVLPVSDVDFSAAFYRDQLGFGIDFLHGSPPFYGAVSRDGARLHLKFVHEWVLDVDAARREGLISAYIEAPHVRELYSEFQASGVEIVQKLTKQAWGGTDFIIRDPEGNGIAFVG